MTTFLGITVVKDSRLSSFQTGLLVGVAEQDIFRTHTSGHSVVPEYDNVRLSFDAGLIVSTLADMVVQELQYYFCIIYIIVSSRRAEGEGACQIPRV